MRGYRKENNSLTLDDVWARLGVKSQHISYWNHHPASSSMRSNVKYKVILLSKDVFSLCEEETEALANKAGLSVYYHFLNGSSTYSNKNENKDFSSSFQRFLLTYDGKMKSLYESAQIDERMFRNIKLGRHLKKESIIALCIAMGLNVADIQQLLMKARYILSSSLINDMVIMWMLTNNCDSMTPTMKIVSINEELDSLQLPLLMTHSKGR